MEKIKGLNKIKEAFPKFSILVALTGILLDQTTTLIAIKFFNCVEGNPITSKLINLGLQYWLAVDYAVCGLILLLIILFAKYILKSKLPYTATFPLTFGRLLSGLHNLIIILMNL